ncbi:DUF6265 family protein [Neptunicella marina]|uniref:DUF6265 domain-containing protein n=1 Tax=Neptunicella marina TaxID=2125989 RepID=A0A8J6IW28_9ALTE|nr:DUF6265 family protein [Neptunicella marina]MBC3766767.1 hypothetical protein [Neptunicella marina]
MKKGIVYCLLLLLPVTTYATEKLEHILYLAQNQTSPKASLNVVKWLAGHWRGEAFGGITEEIWAPPLGGSMMGAFKLVMDNQVKFYEIETIAEQNNSLVFRLKHFSGDLKGWEKQDETVNFPLVKVTTNKVYFDGLTVEKVNDDEINIYVAIEKKNTTTEEKFNYKRVH